MRLVYYLRLERERIGSYYERKRIPLPIRDSLDFTVYDNQIVLDGAKLLEEVITNHSVHVKFQGAIFPGKINTYH